MKKDKIKKIVKEGYGKIAEQDSGCGCGCGPTTEDLSKNIGYSNQEIQAVPDGSNLGLGCGNPTGLASLKPGETVLDLGSGAGFDAFLAANQVGKTGYVIGIDMTPEMIEKAKNNAKNYSNVEFRLGEIEKLPVEDNSIDAIISNCVINLSPDKEQVFKEAYRVLKPGGRLMISDIVLLKELPEEIMNSDEAYIGCIAGAVLKDKYIGLMKQAGFKEVKIISEKTFSPDYLANDPSTKEFIKKLSPEIENKNLFASINVYGIK